MVQEIIEPVEQESVAHLSGQAVITIPKDLYIPPDALEVVLETFEGPMDLLLYMIRRQNLDILNIPVAEITRQYMQYIEVMEILKLELAAEYLVMAAMLAEIKSRMLLPRPKESESEEEDPRAELIRRLQEYERFKKAAEDLNEMPRVEREIFPVAIDIQEQDAVKPKPNVELQELLIAISDVFKRAQLIAHHHVMRETLSIRERMTEILQQLTPDQFTQFVDLFNLKDGRLGVIVTFIAILELLHQASIEMVQSKPYGPIYIKALG